jgi:hypothetical protein
VTSRTFLILELPAALCAQKSLGSWSNLRGLRVGQGIEVIESSMKHHGGEFVSDSDDVVTPQEKGSDVSVKREDIVRVSTASGARRGEHAVIDLMVGAAVGLGASERPGGPPAQDSGEIGGKEALHALRHWTAPCRFAYPRC